MRVVRASLLRAALEPDRLLPWASVAGVFAWFAAIVVRFPPADGDLLWQRWLGARILREHAIPRALGPETFAANGAPWTPHEWLFSTALAFGAEHGAPWLVPPPSCSRRWCCAAGAAASPRRCPPPPRSCARSR